MSSTLYSASDSIDHLMDIIRDHIKPDSYHSVRTAILSEYRLLGQHIVQNVINTMCHSSSLSSSDKKSNHAPDPSSLSFPDEEPTQLSPEIPLSPAYSSSSPSYSSSSSLSSSSSSSSAPPLLSSSESSMVLSILFGQVDSDDNHQRLTTKLYDDDSNNSKPASPIVPATPTPVTPVISNEEPGGGGEEKEDVIQHAQPDPIVDLNVVPSPPRGKRRRSPASNKRLSSPTVTSPLPALEPSTQQQLESLALPPSHSTVPPPKLRRTGSALAGTILRNRVRQRRQRGIVYLDDDNSVAV
jgi:hypothetical protein